MILGTLVAVFVLWLVLKVFTGIVGDATKGVKALTRGVEKLRTMDSAAAERNADKIAALHAKVKARQGK